MRIPAPTPRLAEDVANFTGGDVPDPGRGGGGCNPSFNPRALPATFFVLSLPLNGSRDETIGYDLLEQRTRNPKGKNARSRRCLDKKKKNEGRCRGSERV